MSNPWDDWIGRQSRRDEAISPRLLAQFRATLAGSLAGSPVVDAVPPGLHWALFPDLVEPVDLGRDGHPRTGLFVPKLPLPRRMWAGGELEHLSDFQATDHVVRESVVTDITFKEGGAGTLGFVTIRHDWSAGGVARLRERQDIVYREEFKQGQVSAPPPQAPPWQTDFVRSLMPDPVLLFRYSALTFNGHRIHYDLDYATGIEGYAGLVVHGPLQAIWMLNLATEVMGHVPARFTYRGLSPLIAGQPIEVQALYEGADLALRVINAGGVATMQAKATA